MSKPTIEEILAPKPEPHRTMRNAPMDQMGADKIELTTICRQLEVTNE